MLLLNELQAAHERALFLPLPRDSRLRPLAGAKLPPALKDLSVELGLSEKIISRLFKRDTGLNYQQWRQQWRVFKAIEQLA
ncbi:MAG TPA: AraC family transcriptional regulator, partial [Alcaligenes faecalis]|nr:AraC family transcriptional regulator [Alcaligenes faecalis]